MNPGNNDYNEETVKKAKDTVNSFLENNYQDINSIELEEPYKAPMGSLTIEGTVNEDHKFTITLDDDGFKVIGIAVNKGFPPVKKACEKQHCDY